MWGRNLYIQVDDDEKKTLMQLHADFGARAKEAPPGDDPLWEAMMIRLSNSFGGCKTVFGAQLALRKRRRAARIAF